MLPKVATFLSFVIFFIKKYIVIPESKSPKNKAILYPTNIFLKIIPNIAITKLDNGP